MGIWQIPLLLLMFIWVFWAKLQGGVTQYITYFGAKNAHFGCDGQG
jgi:hypothetical protein